MRESHAFRELHAFRVQESHGSVFSDSLNVQKCVTQIIYLGPLPNAPKIKLFSYFISVLYGSPLCKVW